MKFENKTQVKKWFLSIPASKKDLDLRIRFYAQLISDFSIETFTNLTPKELERHKLNLSFYKEQLNLAKEHYDRLLREAERLLSLLPSPERAVMRAKYLNRISWDAMEFSLFYSRRQSIRFRDKAVARLVGQHVEVCPDGEA